MDPDVLNFAQVSVIIVFLVGSLVTIGTIGIRIIQRKSGPPRVSPASDARLEQLQQSIDAIAVEVERIAEAQRFSAKLLAEKSEDSPSLR
jgi:hypothetical protein